jgi:hypothetical protein
MIPILLAAALLLSLERVAYAIAWRRPGAFSAACERLGCADPVFALERMFYGFKAIQIAVVAGWCSWFGLATGWPLNLTTPVGGLGWLAIALGQLLNLSVFLQLGRVGVFYGNRFGHPTEWRDGLPFSLFAHPQYLGAALTIWGVFLLARFPFDDWFALPLLQSAYYVASAYIEQLPEQTSARSRARVDGRRTATVRASAPAPAAIVVESASASGAQSGRP